MTSAGAEAGQVLVSGVTERLTRHAFAFDPLGEVALKGKSEPIPVFRLRGILDGDLGFQSRLYANLAVAYCALTDRCDEEGIAAAQASITLDRRLGQLDHLAVPLIVLGQIYQCHGGEPARALGYYREALRFAEESGEPQLLFPCYDDGLATLHLDMGDEAAAEAYMRKAQEVCERAGVDPELLIVLPLLG